MAVSAGVAYVDVLPNMKKFAPALGAQTSAASGALAKFGKVGALAVGAVGVASVAFAADFEKSMRNVNSIAQLPEKQFDRLNEKVLALAGPTAQAPKTLAEGLYDLVSSGFDANESLRILKASAFAATAGLTTTEVSTKAVAAVLNAYRLPAQRASEVSDQLFKTVDRGVLTFEELATNIGDTLPFAASLGVGLDEVGAATATMTKQGLGASETFTRIRNLLQTLIKPGTDLTSAIDELGFESGEALIKEKGLQGALEALLGTTDGTKAEVAKLFPNIRALGGALALTGDNAKAANEDLRGMQDSAGATKAAFEEQSKSLAIQWQRLTANLQVLAIRIGSVLVPALSTAVRWLNEDLGPALRRVGGIASSIGGAIAGAFRSVVSWIRNAISNVRSFLSSFIPLRVVIAAVKVQLRLLAPVFAVLKASAKAALSLIAAAFRVVGAAARHVWNVIRTGATIAGNVIAGIANLLRGNFGGAWQNVRAIAGAALAFMRSSLQAFMGAARAVFSAFKAAGTAGFNAVKGAVSALLAPIRAVISAIREAIGVVGDLIGAVGDAINTVGNLASKISSLPGKAVGLLPGLAGGGPVTAGESYLVGEKGPELFEPSVSGRIIPNHQLAAVTPGAGGRVEMTITNWDKGTGYIRRVAGGEISNVRRADRQRARMST